MKKLILFEMWDSTSGALWDVTSAARGVASGTSEMLPTCYPSMMRRY